MGFGSYEEGLLRRYNLLRKLQRVPQSKVGGSGVGRVAI